jgi:hypothetical protein
MADITVGQRLVQTLNESLAQNVEWDAGERVVLTLIEQSADRVEVPKTLLDAAAGCCFPPCANPRAGQRAGQWTSRPTEPWPEDAAPQNNPSTRSRQTHRRRTHAQSGNCARIPEIIATTPISHPDRDPQGTTTRRRFDGSP